jgi:hypothetical protein
MSHDTITVPWPSALTTTAPDSAVGISVTLTPLD